MSANLHHLYLFYHVARAGGIGAAARVIPGGIQQPAISQQLARLEKELGVRLVERRPFSLTPAGEQLLRYVGPFFDRLDEELSRLRDAAGIRLRLGCPAVISSHYLPELVSRLVAARPEVRPQITELEGVRVFAALQAQELDVAIAFAAPPRTRQLAVHELLTLPNCLVAPAGHPFVREGYWAKRDLAAVRWIALQEATGGTRDLREGLLRLGLTPEFAASTNSIEAALNYVAHGLGLALMARPPAALLKPRGLVALAAADKFGEVRLTMSWRRDLDLPERLMRQVLALARELSAELAAR